MQRIITHIPAIPQVPRLLRVAGYARVSSGKDAMLHSLSAQVSYYNKLIQSRRGWTYVGVFVDEALTGTREERAGFQDMLDACRAGHIDMIITKSIARFARNTVTLLETVRELKELKIDVFFERENIHSMSEEGELMLTLLASFAQEESKSASDNMKWRIRNKFAEGELVNFRFMYGYRIIKGEVHIEPKEAEIVRMIFADYIGGMGGSLIAKKLREMGAAPLRGGKWNAERVVALVKNEKYTGNALLQKKFVLDHLTKKLVWNKGRLPQYYAEGTHPAIIDEATFEMAQEIMDQRRQRFKNRQEVTPNRYPFSGKILCGGCGKNYKRKTTAGKEYWQCSTYLQDGRDFCRAKQIPEDILISETTAALELAVFDEAAFHERIASIVVPAPNRLIFIFHDGHEVERVWQDRSRRDSWSDEMRQAARERMTPELRDASRERMHKINERRRKRQ